jgi:hypothetical protein
MATVDKTHGSGNITLPLTKHYGAKGILCLKFKLACQ